MSFNPGKWEEEDSEDLDKDLGFPDGEDWKEFIYPSSHQLNQEDKQLNNDDENDGN